MELADVRAEQHTFPRIDEQHHPVGQVGFQFQRERTAVDETVLVQQRSTVRQQLVAPVAGFIPGESRQPQREEKGLSHYETAPVNGGKAILLREGVPVREYDCDVSWDWNLGYAGIDFGENINFENGVRYSIQLPAGSTSALYRTDIVNEEAIVNFIGGYTEPVKPIQYTWCSLFDNHTTDVLGEVKFYYDRPIALSANPIIKLNIENENLTVKEVVPTISEENGDWVLAADFENIPLISEKGYTIIIPEGTIVSKEGDVVVNQRNVMEIGSSSGIVEIENREVSINSANGVISIGQIFKGCNIKLFSLDGTMIYNTKTSEGNVSISVPTFGVYLLSINGKTYKIAVK